MRPFFYWLLFRWDKANAIIELFLFSVLVLLIDFTVFPGFAALVDAAIASVVGYGLLAAFGVILVLLVPAAPSALGTADRVGVIELTQEQQFVRRVFALVFSDIPEFVEAAYEYFFEQWAASFSGYRSGQLFASHHVRLVRKEDREIVTHVRRF